MDEKTRLEAREYLLKSKLYRFMAMIFFALGVVLFLFLYLRYVEGNLSEALRRPATILVFLLPFIPAAVLTRITKKYEKKLFETLEGETKDDHKA